jgi:hypothetical protein
MAYKGSDLNLRSSPGWSHEESATHSAWAQGAQRGALELIAVDDSVEACCNAAFDAAAFHAAAEVRLEHLLHGMTRVRAAADLLEQLGVRVGQLRHETAVAIASEAPTAEGRSAPRTSTDMEEVVRRAAALGAERRAPASVADLLRSLVARNTATSSGLLLRAAGDASVLERWRDAQGAAVLAAETDARALRPSLAEALFKRLDAMEVVLRSLQADVAADRRAITDALATNTRAASGIDPAHLQALTQTLEDRIGAAVADTQPSENLAYLDARLDLIEKQVGQHTQEVVDAVSGIVQEHLAGSQGHAGGPGIDSAHLTALEASIEGQLQRADEAAKTHEHSLSEIYEALVKLGTNQQTLASNLNTWRVESSGDIGIVSNRLEAMERAAQQTFNRIDGQVQSLRLVNRGPRSNGRRIHGFKRWLYGTSSVLSGAWRDDPDSVHRGMPKHAEPANTSKDAAVVVAPDEETKVEIKTQA